MDNQLLLQAAAEYGTPAYIFDLDAFTDRIRHMKEILGGRVKLYYAMKANPFLTASAACAADGLEVCSPGEYDICRRAKIPPEQIVLSGVNKDRTHISSVFRDQGAGACTAESLNQLRLLEECAAKSGCSQVRVLLRLTSGSQFGMDEETILSVVRDRGAWPHLNLAGLQYYSGTQKKGLDRIRKELLHLDHFLSEIRQSQQFELGQLEYGPGFQIPYFEGQEEPDEDALLLEFKKILDSLEYTGIIYLEAGRFLAAPCGSYITRMVDIKRSQGQGYCIVDGGINHVNYYGQAMAMKIPRYRFLRPGDARAAAAASAAAAAASASVPSGPGQAERWTICGSLCTSGDILVKNLPLPGPELGDILVFDRIGAYSVTEGIYLFLSRSLPSVLTYTKSSGLKLVRGPLPTDGLNDGSI